MDDELWASVAALAHYGVVTGYTDQVTCHASGTTAPCFLPHDTVNRVQVVSIVTRAFSIEPNLRPDAFWTPLAANPSQYTNVPNEGSQRSDLATYRANAGPVSGQADDGTFPDPQRAATRRFVIQVIWRAYTSAYGVDRAP